MIQKKNDNRVLVIGSVALDDIQTPFARRKISLGGSAVYFSWACSIFSKVSMVGVVGTDFPGEYIDSLNKRGIDTQSLCRVKGKTFHWQGRYDNDFNTAHTIKTDLNVFADFKPAVLPQQTAIKYLFLANIDPVLQLKVAKSMKSPYVVATDTMNYWIESKRKDLLKVLKITDFLLINDAEARQLGKETNLMTACGKILSWGPKVVIVKQGEYGVTMFYTNRRGGKVKIFSAPAFPLGNVADPTGAGDSFAGGFMGYLASTGKISEDALRQAVVIGSIVASFTVEDFSIDMLKRADLKKINKRFNELRRIAFISDIKEAK